MITIMAGINGSDLIHIPVRSVVEAYQPIRE